MAPDDRARPDELATSQVAEMLGLSRPTVSRIQHRVLPFRRTSPRGPRFYRRSDVEAYIAGLQGPPVTKGLDERVTALEAWRTEHEEKHGEHPHDR